ncbi:MAG TPA: sulfite exporter TauE/SafE family protein [Bosea sp. (in: a-proteobacteria)]|jgi:uncharacterized membrane protein YfcA|uniref:sulfite exporter TauE/SafE family protein n=1 Tax=Bosea sp. (in: a-proteobacteria) TaxID=1871050 RepID=UPI002E15124D|nr:sulfite exporter TauE/SafE family protein [Bosea sp. (in: a-proteobacteria)]
MAADVTLLQYALVGFASLLASVVGGVAGYGTGLLLPPVLIPLIGAEAVVPVIGLSALATNGSRLIAFRQHLDWRRAGIVSLFALPFSALGAYGYTLLSGPGAMLLIGLVLIVLVPARRLLARRHGHLTDKGLALASGGYGLLVGGTSGSGVFLISMLLAAGLSGMAVIATDAAISLPVGIVKSAVFLWQGALPLSAWIMAGVIGLCAIPGAFLARRLTGGLSLAAHAWILDGVVILGGALVVLQALRHLG